MQSMGAEYLEFNFEEDGADSGGYAKKMSKYSLIKKWNFCRAGKVK